jgi:hypothetical protein
MSMVRNRALVDNDRRLRQRSAAFFHGTHPSNCPAKAGHFFWHTAGGRSRRP